MICSLSLRSYFFLAWLRSGLTVVGNVRLVRSSQPAFLFKSYSPFVDTAFSVKLYCSVCRPVAFVIKEAQSTAQHSAKINPDLSRLPEGKNKFSNTPSPSDETLLPQNLQLLLWQSIFGFLPRLQSFVGVGIPC